MSSGSPVVEYGYADGSNNTIRMTFLKYPDGRQVDYDYGSTGGQNDRLSRVENLDDAAGSLTTYQYAGIGQVISAEYTEPDLTYSIPGGMTGGYTGLDRFGRMAALQWKKGTAQTVGFEYGYDRRGNRLFEKNTSTAFLGNDPVKVDALLEYDGLDRLVDYQRGTLNSTKDAITSPNLTQDWTLDQTGNWDEFNQGITNAGSQTRTHNEVNEITGITVTSGSAWDDPAHDANGNMTEIPKPNGLSSTYTAKWDAWNRGWLNSKTAPHWSPGMNTTEPIAAWSSKTTTAAAC